MAPAIEAHAVLGLTIADCLVEMHDVATTKPAVFVQGEDLVVERNILRVRPVPVVIFKPIPSLDNLQLLQQYEQDAEGATIVANLAFGGIQVGGLSERVRILGNVIHGGIYNGIALGSLRFVVNGKPGADTVGGVSKPEDPCPPGDTSVPPDTASPDGDHWVSAGPLYDLYIEHNRILDMGLSGISVIGFFDPRATFELISIFPPDHPRQRDTALPAPHAGQISAKACSPPSASAMAVLLGYGGRGG